jgi:hypothetical protein
MKAGRGAEATKIRVDFHADLAWILNEGLGNGSMIGYGCDVVIGQQAC